MPELPEVETTLRGIRPHIIDQSVKAVVVRQRQLRVPVSRGLKSKLKDQVVHDIERRAKYLLFHFDCGTLAIHLGMSGSLRVTSASAPIDKHDHVDLLFNNGAQLRFRDPRRFGLVVWLGKRPLTSRWLAHLGPEPLSDNFNGDYLYSRAANRRGAVKNFIMDGRIVVGVGNIYASEALHHAHIHPARGAGRISRHRYDDLCVAIKGVLARAIDAGGTTLRDYVSADGVPGFFEQQLAVYGREGSPCGLCSAPIRRRVIGQRSSFFCSQCQR